MKTIESMTMAQKANFYAEVKGYLRDNISFITQEGGAPIDLATAALDHYEINVENVGQPDEVLSEEQKAEFHSIAKSWIADYLANK